MSAFFDEVAALMSDGLVYIVDMETGKYADFTAEQYVTVSSLVALDRFKVRLSLKSALELSHKIVMTKAGHN